MELEEESDRGQKRTPVMAALKKALGGWGSICQAAMQGQTRGHKRLYQFFDNSRED